VHEGKKPKREKGGKIPGKEKRLQFGNVFWGHLSGEDSSGGGGMIQRGVPGGGAE